MAGNANINICIFAEPQKSAVSVTLVLLRWLNKSKYVNMTDVIPETHPPGTVPRRQTGKTLSRGGRVHDAEDIFWFIEAFFFAYRDFIGDPDRILAGIGFGRAHHRVLHFVCRYPGMRVAGLLEILQITKQSLARVLRDLIKEGYIEQRSGKADRRERLLYLTPRGRALARRLAEPQIAKMREALSRIGEEERPAVAEFLEGMISGAGRLPAMKRRRSDPAGGNCGETEPEVKCDD
jgi:DNA-binding MarR family transcriptional regulator